MFQFNNWFFDRFPKFFKENDTYKDSEGKGIFERFLSIFGNDLDEVTMPLLRNGSDIANPEISKDLLGEIINPGEEFEDKFLNLIAYTLGYPPHRDIYKDPATVDYEIKLYRNLLSMTTSLNKIRGTAKALVIWGNLLGLNLKVYESPKIRTRYDEVNWDDLQTDIVGSGLIQYDSDCSLCGSYIVVVGNIECDPNNPGGVIQEEILEILNRIICYNEPMDSKLKGLVSQSLLCDSISKCSDETIDVTIDENTRYDSDVSYDFKDTYDNNGEIITRVFTSECQEGIEFWAIEEDFVVGPQ